MSHSLRVRLKNLQRKGELTEKDVDRIFKALSQEQKSGKWIDKDDFIYALKTCGFSVHHGQVMYAEDDLIRRFDEIIESEDKEKTDDK